MSEKREKIVNKSSRQSFKQNCFTLLEACFTEVDLKVKLWHIIRLVMGFIAGNFIWEIMQKQPNFLEATERSYFQIILALAIWWQISCRKVKDYDKKLN